MITIEQSLYDKMPDDIKKCFNALPNDGSEQVTDLFPQNNSNSKENSHTKPNSFVVSGSSWNQDNTYSDSDSGSAARFFYCAKASKGERNKGLDGFEKKAMNDLNKMGGSGNTMLTGSGNERTKEYLNHHPTVKPVSLMRYLVRLVTPKDGIVLDPFNGSGTTGIACKLEGFDYLGIELAQEYCDISEARIGAWESEEPELKLFDENLHN